MSGFFGTWRSNTGSKATPSLPAVTAAEKQRSKQVQLMRNDVNGLVEIELNVLYQVQVNAGGREFYILIRLPPGFPKDPPLLSVTPHMVHNWIDEQSNIIGSPLLKNYSMHLSLGKVINQVIKEFIEYPPLPASSQTSSTNATHSTTAHRRSAPVLPSKPHHHNAHTSPSPLERYMMPAIPEEFPDLKDYSTEKLDHFLHATEGFIEVQEYISKLPIIVQIRKDRSRILDENESQARKNLSLEPELEAAWDTSQEKFLQLQTFRENFKKLYDEHQKYLSKYKPSTFIAKLKDAVQECEHKTEQQAEDFLQKKISVDDFLKDYLTDRKLYYLRQGKQVRLRDSQH